MTTDDYQFIFEELVNRKDFSLPFTLISKTDEIFRSITSGRLRLIHSLFLINTSLDAIVKALGKNDASLLEDFTHSKKVFGDYWDFFSEKLAHPCEYSKKFIDYSKPLLDLKSEK